MKRIVALLITFLSLLLCAGAAFSDENAVAADDAADGTRIAVQSFVGVPPLEDIGNEGEPPAQEGAPAMPFSAQGIMVPISPERVAELNDANAMIIRVQREPIPEAAPAKQDVKPSPEQEKTAQAPAPAEKAAVPEKDAKESKGKKSSGKPKLALVIDDFGTDSAIAKRILSMGLCATWAVVPTTKNADAVAKLAFSSGQPFLVHVPMQALVDKNGSREYKIGVDTSAEKIRELVDGYYARFPNAVGMSNHRGSKATSDAKTMEDLMSALEGKKWGFFDSRTIGKSVAKKTAEKHGIKAAENRIFIDGSADLEAMKKNFNTVRSMARKNGYAAAICHARSTTLKFLEYIKNTKFDDIEFVTVDELWK